MPFSPEVKAEALIACSRHCCICNKFCGVRMECHHIVPEAKGGGDDLDNCIPLCFACHAEVGHYNPQHPKGNKFTSEELRGHRDKTHRALKEAIIQAMTSSTKVCDAPPEVIVLPQPIEPELSEGEVRVLACIGEGIEVLAIVFLTDLSETHVRFYLGELASKELISRRSYTDGKVTWHLKQEGRRYVITKNLMP